MLMLPKLQFLATGGYDGKMILWDTVNHQIKFQYIEHTRSISSITFH
jgi:WD40 repeat protein